jgi:hypothetical protein
MFSALREMYTLVEVIVIRNQTARQWLENNNPFANRENAPAVGT